MRRWKAGLTVIGAALALMALLPFVWVASNAVQAFYFLAFTTQPTKEELAGAYKATLDWGTATLTLHSDNTFEESIVISGRPTQRIIGHWESSSGELGQSTDVALSPDLQITHNAFGQQYDMGIHSFYKPRIGQIFAELDPDLGIRFTKVNGEL